MVQGASLSEAERSMVFALRGEGKTNTSIASHINRCRGAVRRVIQAKEVCEEHRRRGPLRKVLARVVHIQLRQARIGLYTSRERRDL